MNQGGKQNADCRQIHRGASRMPAFLLCTLLLATAQRNTFGQSSSISGSVPSGPATSSVLHLSLRDAIQRAVQFNLAEIESAQNTRIARGERLIALSKLLPQISGDASEEIQQLDLSSLGLKIPGIPNVIGPFGVSGVEGTINQTIVSSELIRRFLAARSAEQAAQLNYQDALDLVTLSVGNAYLLVIEAHSRIEAQDAQVRNARVLFDQARDEVEAGTAPRIDETQTEVQLHSEEYTLSVTRNNFAVAKLNLARAIGLPLGQQFDLTDQLPYSEVASLNLDEALSIANRSRSDLKAALASQHSATQSLSAARMERLPIITASGHYGDQGTTFAQSHGEFTFQGEISVPLFTGGRIKGDIAEAQATLRQKIADTENLRGQIDYDVRTAFLNLNAANEQVTVARQNVGLANDSLTRSKDRFASGVTNSVEVVQAEQSLANADDQYITSLYNYNFAKLSLARALGVARTNFEQYLGGK
jgi:outer membrane protein TolC